MSLDRAAQGDAKKTTCDKCKRKIILPGSDSFEPAKESELLPLGAFYIQKYGFLFQIPPSATLEIVQGTLCGDEEYKSTKQEIHYVYEFSQNTSTKLEFPMHFELFRTQNSSFINLRVTSKESKLLQSKVEGLRDDIFQSVLRASIVNDKGNYVQTEKLAYVTNNPNGGFSFQLLNFVSIPELLNGSSILLNRNSSLNINIQFQSTSYEFPDSVMLQHFGFASQDVSVTHPKYYGIFHQLVRDQGFSSVLKTELVKPMFTDVTLKIVMNENIVGKIPAHSVMLSAFSSKFTGILRNTNEITFNGFAPGIIRLMLDFIYGGTLHTTDLDHLIQLIKLADDYKVIGLRNACVDDIYHMFGKPNGLRNMTACFKLGQLIKSMPLVDKAIENLIWLINNNPEGYNNELDKIEANYPELVDDLMKMEEIIGNIVPIEKEIRKTLVKIPSPEVKVLGTYTESFHGILFLIRKETCLEFQVDMENGGNHLDRGKVYVSQLMDIQKEKSRYKGSTLEIFYKKRNKVSGIHIRLLTKSGLNSAKIDDIEQTFAKSQLKLSVFDQFGRIVIESCCCSFSDGTDNLIWEISPFLTLENFKQNNLVNDDGEILIRIGISCSQNYPKLDQITEVEEKKTYENYNNQYFSTINRDQYRIRLSTQLKFNHDFCRPAGHSSLYLVDKDKNKLAVFRVDPVILSAFSKVLKQQFLHTRHIGLSVENYRVETVQLLLTYFYGGPIVFDLASIDIGLELLCGAQELEISGLVCLCMDKILNFSWDMQHGILLYRIGQGMKSIVLKNKAILYFRRNWENFKSNNEFQLFLKDNEELNKYLNKSSKI